MQGPIEGLGHPADQSLGSLAGVQGQGWGPGLGQAGTEGGLLSGESILSLGKFISTQILHAPPLYLGTVL